MFFKAKHSRSEAYGIDIKTLIHWSTFKKPMSFQDVKYLITSLNKFKKKNVKKHWQKL